MAVYSQYKELLVNKDKEGVKVLFQNADAAELVEVIVPRIVHNHAVKILSDILKSFPDTENAQVTRRKVVEAVLTTIKTAEISNAHANALVERICEEFCKYSKLQLVRLVDYCLNSLRNNDDKFSSWKDILPEVLQILEEEKYINHRGTEVSGTDYKSQIISSICNQPWDLQILTPLATMFTTIRMEQNDHGMVIRALCSKIDEVNHNELPPLVHQLLRLSDKQDGRLVIGTLQKYFSNLYAQVPDESPNAINIDNIGQISLKEIQETESTVLYHIHQSAILNHSGMKDFMRHLKSITNAPELVLTPFSLSVLLLVSDIYEDQVFEIITQATTRKVQDDEKRNNSAWLRQVLPDNFQLMNVMNQIIDNSTKDRHLVIKGLVDLAFVMMESKLKENDENLLHAIGVKIIEKLIKKRHEIGPTVIQRLTNKIVASGTSVSQYVECLSYMCRKSTLIVLDSQGWISTLLEQLLLIPGSAATQVLHATLPLMRVSTTIRDSLVLILRKALYRKGIDARQMAVTGFLQFLTHLKIGSLNLSQSSSSTNCNTSGSIYTQATVERNTQHTGRSDSRNNSAFCHEILGILKRCFYHEHQVRQHLYKGLADAVSSNPELTEYVIDMLLGNLKTYYESDEDIKPPLKFHDCSNINGAEAFIEEPIGDLIFALQRIYCNMAHKDFVLMDQLGIYLESLCRRLAHTELEHLNIDDHIDLLDNIPKAQQKVLSLKLMATTLEALIAFRISAWSIEHQDTASSVNSLFKTYYGLHEFTKRVSKPKKGDSKKKKDNNATDTTINKKARGRTLKLPSTMIDIQVARKMISLLYESTVPFTSKEQAGILKNRVEFHLYSLRACISIFQNAKSLHNYDRRKHWDKYKLDYLGIGDLLYKHIVADLDSIREFNENVALVGLECFKELCDLICTTFNAELPEFLNRIGPFSSAGGLDSQLIGLMSSMQCLIDTFYDEEIDPESTIKRVPLLIFEIISLLMQKTPLHNTKMDKLFEWLKKLSRSEKIDAPIAIIILQLITTIEERDSEYGKILDDMSIELCKNFGTVDNTMIEVREVYKILNDTIMPQAHTLFNNSLKNKINNASWVLGRLKAEQIHVSTAGISDESHRENLKLKERSLCRHLSYAIATMESLANAKVTPGPNTDGIFKNLHLIYSVLNNLTKYFTSKSTPQNPAFQAVKFIQVVQLAGKSLKTYFYNLISYTEENQTSNRRADVHALRNKVLKETKFIPKVVYEIEQFMKEILALGKKTGTSLDSYLKHSITRDFRIRHGELAESLERCDVTQMMTQNTQAEPTRESSHSSTECETSTKDSDLDSAPTPKRLRREN